MRGILNTLSEYLDRKNLAKIKALNNRHVEVEIERFLKLCKPAKTTVITDDQQDIDYVRQLATMNREESFHSGVMRSSEKLRLFSRSLRPAMNFTFFLRSPREVKADAGTIFPAVTLGSSADSFAERKRPLMRS